MQKVKNLEKLFELLLATLAILVILKGWPGLEAHIPWSNDPMIGYLCTALAISTGFAFGQLKSAANRSKGSPEFPAISRISSRANLTMVLVGIAALLGTIVKLLAPRFL